LNNPKIGLPRAWIKNYRAAIHNANKFFEENGELPENKINELSGMTSWVRSVNTKRYENLISSGTKLLNKVLSK